MSLITIIIVVILLILVLAIRGAKSPENPAVDKDCQNYEGGSCCCGGGHCHEENPDTDPIVYFDDDELDTLAGRDPETYDEEELELFREIASTIRDEEKAEWYHSLKLRGILLPSELRNDHQHP